MPSPHHRRSLKETWKFLEDDGLPMPRTADGEPFVRLAMPGYDDEEPLGFSYFRSGLGVADLSNLSLPRTFFGRSSFEGVSFQNTDLSESRMCWNDFTGCDFSNANLTGCDLRASNFTDCNFTSAIMALADLRCSSYEDCDFTDAILTEASADWPSAKKRGLLDCITEKQKASVKWHEEPGPDPGGG